jgi:hypothetical protein
VGLPEEKGETKTSSHLENLNTFIKKTPALVCAGLGVINIEEYVGDLSGAYTHIGSIKEEANHENNSHTSGCCNKPEGKSSLCPSRFPGNSWSAVRQTIGNTTVWQI